MAISTWARRRQLVIGGCALLFLVLVFGVPMASRLSFGNACNAGACGGECLRLCAGGALSPRVLWQRVFNEGGGVASVLLYGENPNRDAGAFAAHVYTKVYDSAGVLVAEKEVVGSIAPGSTFAVFVPNLFVGSRVPVRAVFEFRTETEWRRDVPVASSLRAGNVRLSLTPVPRVEATLVNTAPQGVSARAVAILYDFQGNAVGASETVTDIGASGSVPLSFSWRTPFAVPPVRAEIVTATIGMLPNR